MTRTVPMARIAAIVAALALGMTKVGHADTINPRFGPKPGPTPTHSMSPTDLCHDIHLFRTQKERDMCMITNMPDPNPPK